MTAKPLFSFRIDPSLYQRLNKNVKKEERIKFVHDAIDSKLIERELFDQKLVEDYQTIVKNKKLQKELEP